MVGKDLRCPECSSFAIDVDPDLSLNTCTDIAWTCESGHKVLSELQPTVVVRARVIGKRELREMEKLLDPPKAEEASS